MMYKAKVVVWPDIRTKHSKQRERHVEILSIKPGGTEKKKTARHLKVKTLLYNNFGIQILYSFPRAIVVSALP